MRGFIFYTQMTQHHLVKKSETSESQRLVGRRGTTRFSTTNEVFLYDQQAVSLRPSKSFPTPLIIKNLQKRFGESDWFILFTISPQGIIRFYSLVHTEYTGILQTYTAVLNQRYTLLIMRLNCRNIHTRNTSEEEVHFNLALRWTSSNCVIVVPPITYRRSLDEPRKRLKRTYMITSRLG